MAEARDIALATEGTAAPIGRYEESFSGYGVMGLPFSSGHVLAVRRFPASSLGGAYTSVWHRDPSGRWSFRQDVPADLSCPRYFGAAVADTFHDALALTWTGPRSFEVTGEGLRWRVEVAPTPITRAMSAVASRLPARAWDKPIVLAAMGRMAGGAMGVGRVRLDGRTPNGQRFQAHPLHVWMVSGSTAVVNGEDLGDAGALPGQARLGDFFIPQRGVFAVGRSFFEELEPAALHER